MCVRVCVCVCVVVCVWVCLCSRVSMMFLLDTSLEALKYVYVHLFDCKTVCASAEYMIYS